MVKGKIKIATIIQKVNYILLFILVWQCLLPLKSIATENVLSAYIFFTLLSTVLNGIGMKKYISFPILTAYALYITFNEFYKGKSDFLGNWFGLFWGNVTKNIDLLLNGTWDSYSSPFNTFIFFYVLYTATILFHIWIRNKWSMFPIAVSAISIIAVMGEFYDYHAKDSFIRVVITGIALIVLTNALRFSKKDHFKLDVQKTLRWILPASFILAIGVLFGFTAPKQEAQWRNPITVMKDWNWFESENGKGNGEGKSGESELASSGYGIDATQLGGDLNADHSIAFIATDQMSHYWKIDDLDTYTGHGWINVTNHLSGTVLNAISTFNTLSPRTHSFYTQSIIVNELESEEFTTAKISIKTNLPRLPYPYPYRSLDVKVTSKNKNGFWYQVDSGHKTISLLANSEDHFSSATYTYKLIEFDIEKLKNVNLKQANNFSPDLINKGIDPNDPNLVPDVYTPDTRYVQLPEGFSNRVKILAEEITKDLPTDYEKVKAIEDYLKNGDFKYSLTGVAVPKKNQDYVEQFLFDTKKGYCDNFSSAFVMLCRTLNYQTRWVRGFNEGTFKKGEMDKKVFEFKNLDAHSWAEVYFNEYGWVPFEPTPGFTNDEMFRQTTEITNPEPAVTDPTIPNKPMKPEDLGSDNRTKSNEGKLTTKEIIQKYSLIMLYVFGVMGTMIVVLYPMRGKFMPILWIFYFRRRKGEHVFPRAYQLLLKQMERCKLKRKPGVTLREHARYIDHYFNTFGIMEQLTLEYEKYMYRGNSDAIEDMKWKIKWEQLMRHTLNV